MTGEEADCCWDTTSADAVARGDCGTDHSEVTRDCHTADDVGLDAIAEVDAVDDANRCYATAVVMDVGAADWEVEADSHC